MMPYEKLLAWKVAHQLALEIHAETEQWPRNELYGLGSASELSSLLLFARHRGLLSLDDWQHLDSKRNRLGQLLWRLYRSMHNRTLSEGD